MIALAVLGAAALAVPAPAPIDPRFKLVDRNLEPRYTQAGFRFEGPLRDPSGGRRAGHERARCLLAGPNQAECLGVAHLNGKVGGTGRIRFTGDIGSDDRRVNIRGGTGDFAGAGGKLLLRGLGGQKTRFRFFLTFR